MSDTITSINPDTQVKIKRPNFIISAIFILPDIIYSLVTNVKNFVNNSGTPDVEISAESYKTYLAILKTSNVVGIALAVISIMFFIGCISKTAGKNYKPFIKIYFVKQIVYGVAMAASMMLQSIYGYKWVLEEHGAESAMGLQASIMPQIVMAVVMYLPVIIVGILLLAAEISDSSSLRKAIRGLMVVNIVLSGVMFAALLLSQASAGIIAPIIIVATSIALIVYQSNSIKMCKAEA